jgi:hypothetical protein
MTKLKPEIKTRWLEALRSGGYKQARGQLKVASIDGDRFCCLGVLCDLAAQEGLIYWVWETGEEAPSAVVAANPSLKTQTVLPWVVIDWAFDGDEWSADPRVDAAGSRYCLSILNDSGTDEGPASAENFPPSRRPWTFEEIANAIEEQL